MIQPLGLVLVLFSLLGTGLKSSPESMIIIKNKMGVRERRDMGAWWEEREKMREPGKLKREEDLDLEE